MAHEISINNNVAQYASTEREWHGLGQLMTRGATVEEWQQSSGMLYEVQRRLIHYYEDSSKTTMGSVDDKVVLIRSDNKKPLGIVSGSYKVVQPKEVLEFFPVDAALNKVAVDGPEVQVPQGPVERSDTVVRRPASMGKAQGDLFG